MGVDKQEIIAHSLYVVGFDPAVIKKIGNRYVSWATLQNLCAENPDGIHFSEHRMDRSLVDENYMWTGQQSYSPLGAEIPSASTDKLRSVNKIDISTYVNVFDQLLNREILLQAQEDEYGPLLRTVRTRPDDTIEPNFSVTNDILCFNGKILLPTQLYLVASLREHFFAVHCSHLMIVQIITQLYHCTEMKVLRDTAKVITKMCLACLAVNYRQTRLVNDGYFPHRIGPRHFLMADLIENVDGDNQVSILTIIDMYSRYLTCYVLDKKTSAELVSAFTQYFAQNGYPQFLATDNATIFQSGTFKSFLAQFNVQLVTSTPYRSRARALVENVNRIIQTAITKLDSEKAKRDWRSILALACFFVNRKKLYFNPEVSPYQLHYGTMNDDLTVVRKDVRTVTERHATENRQAELAKQAKEFRTLVTRVEGLINARKLRNRDKVNESRRENPFNIGDFVMVKNRARFLGQKRKFDVSYLRTPYQITELGPTYNWVRNIVTKMEIRRSVDEMKLIDTPPDSPWSEIPDVIVRKLRLLKPEDLTGDFETIYKIDEQDQMDLRLTRARRERLAEEARKMVPDETVQDTINELLGRAPIRDEFFPDDEEAPMDPLPLTFAD